MRNDLFLVDTSTWLLVLRKQFIPKVKDRIDNLLKEDLIITTGIVRLELLSGTKTEKEFQRLKMRLDALDTVESDKSLWQDACELGFKLRRKGVTVPHTDILIGACALKTESTIMHADAHFDMMAKHTKLKVESFVTAAKAFQSQK
ncbi:MAG: PIN domain nuclease [Deltaproteobacteria bacterium]|nr:PIN domain nuclease [Deltaproteobacteria bacterium]